MYSEGMSNYRLVDHFNGDTAPWSQFEASAAEVEPMVTGETVAAHGASPQVLGGLFAAGTTVALVALRAIFPGFWFHPAGFILGPTSMLSQCWGSLLAAWLIRLLVLKIGGAAAVRERLMPFAIGMIAGVFVHYTVFLFIDGYIFFFTPGGTIYLEH